MAEPFTRLTCHARNRGLCPHKKNHAFDAWILFIKIWAVHKPGSVLDNHLSRLAIADKLQRPTLPGGNGQLPLAPIWSCSGWGLHGQHVSILPVSSYLTISTLPQPNCFGGMFLLHFPYSYLRQTLSGILPCGARTFLISTLGSTNATVCSTYIKF